ncbi:heme ABC exporter ATP-binding protein CcmA [Ahniella affigens]|uniref:Heme ABC exporter ATP-binding protein CcmA n=1 Tax=Ahniella affigens TaxID=2021234 RepID=A0A2P1PQF4_9GAMM|nr:heme ABC exporter ATP-binding protein CcmA [Ahniella affigens]AVP97077.1 heme ABC exporter ATP-binding protein CcmA [Ahniella affigens]
MLDPADIPLLQCQNLCLSRGEERIFGPLDFSLRSGEALMLEGSNGSGKTSLLRTLMGWIARSDGDILWQGTARDTPPAAIGWLGHRTGLKSELSPLENMRALAALFGLRPGISHRAALQSVGLEGFEDTPLRKLSQGQNRRAALAALMTWPTQMWLLDEPYANLDRDGQLLVDRMLEAHLGRGGAAILTSHGLISTRVSRIQTLALSGGNHV